MESELDEVESGSEDWVKLLKEFYGPFEHALTEAAEHMTRIKVPEIPLEQPCPKCEKPLVLREGKHGLFVGCTGFPECDFTAPKEQFLSKPDEENGANGQEGESPAEQPEVKCEECGAPMVVRHSRRGPFLGCSRYPECKHLQPLPGEDGKVRPKKEPAQLTNVACEKCGKPMALRSSRRGKFLGCSGFPKCRNIKPVPAEGMEILPAAEAPAKEG
jgi:DNA topoisomerase-1